jgi:uncharacterized protein YndB with AHSA1/START domain
VRSRVLVAVRVGVDQEVAFEKFTRDIGQWWRPNALFAPGRPTPRRLTMHPGVDGRLVETYDDGSEFEIGRIKVWEPPSRLVVSWRPASFTQDQETEVHVRFEALHGETRVTVEHYGWDAIPERHAARHGFPLHVFQQRLAEWWQALLASYRAAAAQR